MTAYTRHHSNECAGSANIGLSRFLGCIVLCFACNVAWAQEISGNELMSLVERPDEQIVIFDLRLDGYTLTEGFFVFQDNNDPDLFWVPLSSFFSATEIAIDVTPAEGRATGWAFEESKSFALDLREKTVTFDGRSFGLDPEIIERHFDDIYVRHTALENWLGIGFYFDFRSLTAAISTDLPLPLELRLAAQARRQEIRASDTRLPELQFRADERSRGLPFIDSNVAFALRNNAGGLSLRSDYTIQASSTIAGQDLFLVVDDTLDDGASIKIPNIRLSLGREYPVADEAPVAGLRHWRLGDISTPFTPLVGSSTFGRGLRLSSESSNRRARVNRMTLHGDLPRGWEAELYRNKTLIAFQAEPNDNGRYEFADIPVLSGLTVFRIVLFGPQGQRRDRVERFLSGSSLLGAGETDFEFAANQIDRNLLGTPDTASRQPDDGDLRALFRIEHGLSDRLTLGAQVTRASFGRPGQTSTEANTTDSVFFSGNAAIGLGATVLELDGVVDDTGGAGLQLSALTAFGGNSLAFSHQEFLGLESKITNRPDFRSRLRRTTNTELNSRLNLGSAGSLPVTFQASRRETIDDTTEWRLSSRLTRRFSRFSATIEQRATLRSDRSDQGLAFLRLGTLLGRVNLRGELRTELFPEPRISEADFSLDYRLHNDFGLQGQISRQLDTDLTTFSAGSFIDFEKFAVSMNGNLDTDGNFGLSVALRMSMGLDPRQGEFHYSSDQISHGGAITAFAFRDRNANGRHDSGETGLENVRFRLEGRTVSETTDPHGASFIQNVSPYRMRRIRIDQKSLEDPFLADTRGEVAVMVRPGQTTFLDFPVVPTGEIDGTVHLTREQQTRPGRGARLSLIPQSARPHLQQQEFTQFAGFDGYYYFGQVPYGQYTLTVEYPNAESISVPVELGPDNESAFGVDFELRPSDAPSIASSR